MGESDKILEITKALSDELRLKILKALDSGKAKRYTEIMSDIGMDAVADSSKFAYHVGVLVASGLVEKHGDGYEITPGGKEVLREMTSVSQGWDRFGYRASLERFTGRDLIKVTWARILLSASPFWLLFPLDVLYEGKYGYASLMIAVGLATISISSYLMVSLRGLFDHDLWKTYFSLEAGRSALGEKGCMIDRVMKLSSFTNISLVLVVDFLVLGRISHGPLTIGIITTCLLMMVVSILWSRRIPSLWSQVSQIRLSLDFGDEIESHSHLTIGVLVVIGAMFITLGATQLSHIGKATFGYVGGGVGCFGSALGYWMKFRKQYYGLMQ
jgi:DNA-binding transcriptional ArsR family regulator